MAIRKVYIGSVGPFLFDDAEDVNDPDGDFAGQKQRALTTDAQLLVETAPSEESEVVLYGDLPGSYLSLINSIVTHDGEVVVHEGNVVTL